MVWFCIKSLQDVSVNVDAHCNFTASHTHNWSKSENQYKSPNKSIIIESAYLLTGYVVLKLPSLPLIITNRHKQNQSYCTCLLGLEPL